MAEEEQPDRRQGDTPDKVEMPAAHTISILAPVQYLAIGDGAQITVIGKSTERGQLHLAPSRLQRPLIGRDATRSKLRQCLDGGYLALYGAAGAGKSALVLELVSDQQVLDKYPDGVLWAGLGQRADVLGQLSIWGRCLGVQPESVVPPTIDSWAVAIRQEIGLRRLLLVIDDAWTAEDALAFQVGGPNCSHVVTTRMRDIAFEFGGDALLIGDLCQSDAQALVENVCGRSVDHGIVDYCGGLPMALIIVGRQLRSSTDRGMLAELAIAKTRLSISQRQVPASAHPSIPFPAPLSLENIVGLSYRWVSLAARRALVALSVFPPKPNSFSFDLATAIAAVPATVCDTLLNSALLEEAYPGRLMLHQVVRDFAVARIPEEFGADVGRAARRMVELYVKLVVEGSLLSENVFDTEYQNLMAALDSAISENMTQEVIRLTDSLYPAMEKRGAYSVAKPYLEHARTAARERGDERAEVQALLRLGNVCLEVGDLNEGRRHLQAGVDLAAVAGFADDVADLLIKLGWATGMRGDLDNASTYFSDALTLAVGKREASALQGLGWVAGIQGRLVDSENFLHRGVEIGRGLQDDGLVADLLQVQGWMTTLAGDYPAALAVFEECLALARQSSVKSVEVDALHGLGVVRGKEGRHRVAHGLLADALTIAASSGYHERVPIMRNLAVESRELGLLGEAEGLLNEALQDVREQDRPEKLTEILSELGLLYIRQGEASSAEAVLLESLELAERINVRHPRAQALRGLSLLRQLAGAFDRAREYLMRAMRLEAGNPAMIALLRYDLGELELTRNLQEEASRTFVAVRAAAVRSGQLELAALASYGSARVAIGVGDRHTAQILGEESVRELAQIESPRLNEAADWLARL